MMSYAADSKFAKSLRSPLQWLGVALMLLIVGGAVWASMTGDSMLGPRNTPWQRAHVIALAMYSYANDNNGKYPTGRSSTEVFQKLLDGGYVTDSSLFYDDSFAAFGKKKATSKKLEPKNVCWDVTTPLILSSTDFAQTGFAPVVFLTGFRLNYVPGGSAVSLFPPNDQRSVGLTVVYQDLSTTWKGARPDGAVPNFISPDFKPDGKKYVQLTPDGPLTR